MTWQNVLKQPESLREQLKRKKEQEELQMYHNARARVKGPFHYRQEDNNQKAESNEE